MHSGAYACAAEKVIMEGPYGSGPVPSAVTW